ncbi:hypothetical protein MycrhDRAFT_6354 [Mycolicibacterium rhodesiae JS60]|nr:hypothetical protein MycrhDRAFT_6354 [Mycolicibacterium rhodesiae JS60]
MIPGTSRRAHALMLAAAAVTTSLVVAAPAVAAPNPGDPVVMGTQCSNQYPAIDGFSAGQAYLVAPRDAFSWRCKRVSASGGVIAELPVDPNAYCYPHSAKPAPDGSENWICTS